MAVRADDIALGDLGQYPFGTCSADHSGDRRSLPRSVPVVEIHGTRWKSAATVLAGLVADPIEKAGMLTRIPALPRRGRRAAEHGSRVLGMATLGADPMTVGTHHVALRCLVEQDRRRSKRCASFGQPEPLDRSVAMVEVHLIRLEAQAAILARSRSELAQQLDRTPLANADSRNLEQAVPAVVGDVG